MEMDRAKQASVRVVCVTKASISDTMIDGHSFESFHTQRRAREGRSG